MAKAKAPKKTAKGKAAAKETKKKGTLVKVDKDASPQTKKQTKDRRQLDRRDSDDQADRVIIDSGRLDHFPAQLWQNVTDDDGQDVRKYVKVINAKLLKMNPKGRWTPKMWWGLFEHFGLTNRLVDFFKAPGEDDGVADMEMFSRLKQAHKEGSSIDARASPTERFLADCTKLTRASLYGLIVMSLEGKTLTRPVAMRLHVAILRYFARTESVRFASIVMFRVGGASP
jgi:hypothetical protein